MTKIKTIILDLGGVLYDLDYTATEKAFQSLGLIMEFSRLKQHPIIDDFEIGRISKEEFYRHFIANSALSIEANHIKDAWNKMLLGINADKLDLLKKLSKHYQLFLFSNTNEIHIEAVFEYIKETHNIENFGVYFKKIYLSNEIGLRKPNTEGFIQIIEENKLKPAETLFIDDSPQHVEGAKKTGLQAEWLNLEQEDIFKLLKRISIHF